MKKALGLVICLSFTLAAVWAAPPKVAILDLSPQAGFIKAEAVQVTEIIRSNFVNSGKFSILERSRVDQIMAEQAFSVSDIVDNTDSAIRVGKLVAADYIVGGTIGRLLGKITLNLRLINVSTGKIESAQSMVTTDDALFNDIVRLCGAMTGVMPTTRINNATSGNDRPSSGWAKGAAILGYVSAGLVLFVGIAAAALDDPSNYTAVYVGGVDLLLAAVTFPITAIGGSSALQGGVIGAPGLRITGWIAWGLTLLDGIVEVAFGAGGTYISPLLILSTVLLGTTALVCIATDALFSGSEAETAQGKVSELEGPSVAVLPIFNLNPKKLAGDWDVQVGVRCRVRF